MLEQHAKEFWSNLPNLHEPSPISRGDNAEVIVLLPIFRSHVGWRDVEFIQSVYTRGGVWARHSFLKNTDAVEHGIVVKFWIDATLKEELSPILEQHYIDWDRDVFAADIESLAPRRTIPGAGQHLLPLVDPQLADYDRIMMLSTDVLTVAVYDKIRVFELLSNQSEDEKKLFLYPYNTYGHDSDPLPPEFGVMADSPEDSLEFGTDDASVRERDSIVIWSNSANWEEARQKLNEAGMGEYLQYNARSVALRLNGCISVLPARHLRKSHPHILKSIYNATLLLGNDQVILQCLELKYRNLVVNLLDVLGLDKYGIQYLYHDGICESLVERHKNSQNYFTHHPKFPGTMLPDYFYRALGFPNSPVAAYDSPHDPRKPHYQPSWSAHQPPWSITSPKKSDKEGSTDAT